MGESKNTHFYDFWIFGRVPEPQNQYYLYLETSRYRTHAKNKKSFKTHILFGNLKMSGIHFLKFGKRWAPTIQKDPSNKFLKILDMGPIS